MRNIQLGLFVIGIAISVSGCSMRGGGLSSGTGGGNAVIDPDPFGSGTNPTGSISSECPTNLLGLITLESPTTLPVPLNSPVTYKIQAIGCSGKYSLQDSPSQIFTSSTTVQRTYTTAGDKTETFVINSVNATNSKILKTITKTANITVGAAGSTTPPPPATVPGAPMCAFTRGGPFTGPAAPIKFGLTLMGGTATQAMISDGLAVAATAMNGAQVDVMPGLDGIYRAQGYVSGPGGSNLCQTQFAPPKCTLEMVNTTWNSTDVKLSVPAGIVEATVQGQTVPPGDPTQPRVIVSKVTFGPGPVTGRTIRAEAFGPSFQFGRDKAVCETAPFAIGDAPIANAVVSWISDSDSKVEITKNAIRLHPGAMYPMFHFQILAVKVALDGSVTEEVVVNIPAPFGTTIDWSQRSWKEFSWQSLGRSKDFTELLMPDAHKIGYSLHTQNFANREQHLYYPFMTVDMRANRNSLEISNSPTYSLSAAANDTDIYAGYYQIALCNPTIMQCRY